MFFKDNYKVGLTHSEYADFKVLQSELYDRRLKAATKREKKLKITKFFNKICNFFKR